MYRSIKNINNKASGATFEFLPFTALISIVKLQTISHL